MRWVKGILQTVARHAWYSIFFLAVVGLFVMYVCTKEDPIYNVFWTFIGLWFGFIVGFTQLDSRDISRRTFQIEYLPHLYLSQVKKNFACVLVLESKEIPVILLKIKIKGAKFFDIETGKAVSCFEENKYLEPNSRWQKNIKLLKDEMDEITLVATVLDLTKEKGTPDLRKVEIRFHWHFLC